MLPVQVVLYWTDKPGTKSCAQLRQKALSSTMRQDDALTAFTVFMGEACRMQQAWRSEHGISRVPHAAEAGCDALKKVPGLAQSSFCIEPIASHEHKLRSAPWPGSPRHHPPELMPKASALYSAAELRARKSKKSPIMNNTLLKAAEVQGVR